MIDKNRLSQQQLLVGIERLRSANLPLDSENELLEQLTAAVSDPDLSDYIFCSDLTPLEILARVDAHRPIIMP
jgi:hypothetical protein